MTSALLALLCIAVNVLVVASTALAAGGVLKRNNTLGIRTSATRASDGAWIRGHRAGVLPASVGCAVSSGLAIGALVVRAETASVALAGSALAAILAGAVWSLIAANRATHVHEE